MHKYDKQDIISLFLEEIALIERQKQFFLRMLPDLRLAAPAEIKQKVVDLFVAKIHKLEMKERAMHSFIYEEFERGGYFYAAFADYRDLYPSSEEEEDDYDEVVEEDYDEVVKEEEE